MNSVQTNRLLESLLSAERSGLLSSMEQVVLPPSTRLYDPQKQPMYAHFLTDGIASIVTFMMDGSSVEVGMVGSEGLVEAAHLLGDGSIPTTGFMQVHGGALRMDFLELKRAFVRSPVLRARILEFVQMQGSIMSQGAACNRRHRLEARLAKWLLMIQDRVGKPRFSLILEFMAELIGAENLAASRAAAYLHKQGVITYDRGEVHIINREQLKATACECYSIVENLMANLYADRLHTAAGRVDPAPPVFGGPSAAAEAS